MSLRLTPPAERLNEIKSTFRLLAARACVRPGCLESRIEEDRHQNCLTYHEEWNSWMELEDYVRSDLYMRYLQLMEISIAAPQLRFEGPDRICGLDFVRSLRNKAS